MSATASEVYRETWLRDRFTPERRETVRAYGAILHQLTSEAGLLLPHGSTRGELGAVAVDLGYLADLLEDNTRGDDPQLIRQALRWADQLREVEAEVVAALGAGGGAS